MTPSCISLSPTGSILNLSIFAKGNFLQLYIQPSTWGNQRGELPLCISVNDAKIVAGWYEVDVGLHTETNNFAPNEYIGIVNSSGLAVYKGSTQEIKVQLKVRTESKLRV